MILVRKSEERGQFDHGWLRTWHSFSFGDYQDPEQMGVDSLRVINQDIVAPGTGFGMHGHRDMEIVTYILRGELEHQDSLGHRQRIRAGEVQRMTAGKGIRHSEVNPSEDEEVELLQIWILPDREGLEPGYEQREVGELGAEFRTLVAPQGGDQLLSIHQDVHIAAARLEVGQSSHFVVEEPRSVWLQLARGSLHMGEHVLHAGDGLWTDEAGEHRLQAMEEGAEVLLFDMAPGALPRKSDSTAAPSPSRRGS